MTPETTLLDLLQMGCTIGWPDGSYLKGKPEVGSILVGGWNKERTSILEPNHYSLNHEGLAKAFGDRVFRRSETTK